MGHNDQIETLGQRRNISEIEQIGSGEWLTLYAYYKGGAGIRCYFCALFPRKHITRAMAHDGWDVMIGQGAPGFSQSYSGHRTMTKYHRFSSEPIEPLVFIRSFHGLKPRSIELLEEFRHFHDLYHDQSHNRLLRIDERGEDEIVVNITTDSVQAKTRRVLQFLAARQMALAIFFDHRAEAPIDIDLARAALQNQTVNRNDLRFSFSVGNVNGGTFSRLIGKKLIMPPAVRESGVWPYESRSRQFAGFIIGSKNGHDTQHTCDPEALRDFFGANPTAPHFLTPVWFRRDVLRRYYDDPEKYVVEDGYIRCGSLWDLQIDNDLPDPDRVVVFLGDLGSLAYEEQLYWRSFNVAPEGRCLSVTNYRRSIMAEFADPAAPELIFKSKLLRFEERWEQRYGWQLFRAPHDADAHLLRQLRVPLGETMAEFEYQCLLLAKLLVDSLNGDELIKNLGGSLPDEKSIAKLERFLSAKSYRHVQRDVKFLRLLQSVRSKAAAHRKGSDFARVSKALGIADRPTSEVFTQLLNRAYAMLDDLGSHFVGD